jgi:hypothetical protein
MIDQKWKEETHTHTHTEREREREREKEIVSKLYDSKLQIYCQAISIR